MEMGCQQLVLRKPHKAFRGGLRMAVIAAHPKSLRKPLKAFRGGLRMAVIAAHPKSRSKPLKAYKGGLRKVSFLPIKRQVVFYRRPTPDPGHIHVVYPRIVVVPASGRRSAGPIAGAPRNTRLESRHGVQFSILQPPFHPFLIIERSPPTPMLMLESGRYHPHFI
jgi:hypothetical protein